MLSICVCGLAAGRPWARSYVNAEEDEEEKHAYSAFCPAIFPSCNHPVGRQPAGGETVESWEGGPEPQQLPRAPAEPSQACTEAL